MSRLMRLFSHNILLLLVLSISPASGLSNLDTVTPAEVNSKQILELPKIGVLNPTPLTDISAFQVLDIDMDDFDEIIYLNGGVIDFVTISGQKLRRLRFPFTLHGWNMLDIKEHGGCCLFIFKEEENQAIMQVYNINKNLLGSITLYPLKDWDGSGHFDYGMEVLDLVDLNGDACLEILIKTSVGYDLYPRGLFVIDPKRWHVVRQNFTAGNINDINITDLDQDNLPDFLISTFAPSNDAIVGDWDDSHSVLLGIRGFDGAVLFRRVIGGPLSWVQHRLIDLNGDGCDEIVAAEHSEYAAKEHNTALKVFQLPRAVEIRHWECGEARILIDCFTAWGTGGDSKILLGFDDGTLFQFDCELNPTPLYRFPLRMSFIQDIDLNGDGQKEVLVGLRDENVLVLNQDLKLVGRQLFSKPPVPIRTPQVEFGKFAVISEGRVCGWFISDVKLSPPPSGVKALFLKWGLLIGVIVVLMVTSCLIFVRMIRKRGSPREEEAPKATIALISDLLEQNLLDTGRENIRKIICKEILSKKDRIEVYDYFIFLLGSVEVYDSKYNPLISPWRSAKLKALFTYFIINHSHAIHKEKLYDLFWSNSPPKQAAQNLRIAIHRLNRVISLPAKRRFIDISEQCYFVNPEYSLFIDVKEFERLTSLGDRMMKEGQFDQSIECYMMAIRLYSGDYLMNLYESWSDDHRGYYQKLFIHAQKQAGRYLLNRNMPDKAVGCFRSALKIDEYSEELYVDIMRCHAACGNRKAVMEEYQRLVKILQEELNTAPLPETNRIYQSLIS